MQSIIFSLITPVRFCLLNRKLPNNGIRFDKHETLNPVSFPGWPSFGDLLCDEFLKLILGITFHVPKNHIPLARQVTRNLSQKIATLKECSEEKNFGIYSDYPKSFWLEIKWAESSPNTLIKAQTCDVLWYPSSTPNKTGMPIAIGVENLEYLAKSADSNLNMPNQFPFPSMKIEFLND